MFNTPKSEVILLYAKTPKYKSEGLRPLQKLQNRRFCVALKILIIMFSRPTQKSEIIWLYAKAPNFNRRGFVHHKNSKSEVLRSFKNINNCCFKLGMKLLRFWRVCARRKTSKIGGYFIIRKNSKLGGFASTAKTPNRRFCVALKISYYKDRNWPSVSV